MREAAVSLPGGRWLIDGNNVMGSRPDGWWRDRAGAARRLVAAVAAHPWPEDTQVTVVFDGDSPGPGPGTGDPAGPPGGQGPSQPVEVVHAGRGSSADDRLVEEARTAAGTVTVVTSDRALAARLRELGTTVVPAGRFLRLLEGGAQDPRR